MARQLKQQFSGQEARPAYRLKNFIPVDVQSIAPAIISGLIVAGVMVSPACAKAKQTHGLSATEALNEQQLQNLATAAPIGCGRALPRSLADATRAGQGVTGSAACAATTATTPPEPLGWTLYAGQLVGR